jgi:hypothetical protein
MQDGPHDLIMAQIDDVINSFQIANIAQPTDRHSKQASKAKNNAQFSYKNGFIATA